jgi:hypothetical protein
VTAAVPPRLSPIAGFANALKRLAIRLYGQRETELQQQLSGEQARRAWIDDRIRTETHTGRRTAWRMYRDDHDLEGL